MSADVISMKVYFDAAKALVDLKKTKEQTDALAEAFEKMSDAEKNAIGEMAKLQQAARIAAAEEQKLARESAAISALRIEETRKLQHATAAANAEAKRLTAESNALARTQSELSAAISKTREETEKFRRINDANSDELARSRSRLGLLTVEVGDLGEKIRAVSPYWGTLATSAAGAFARITAGALAVGGALGAATMALARSAAGAEQNDRAVRLLGDGYNAVTDATMGTVSAQDALRLQQGLVQSGLEVTGQQLGVITRAARDYALATGTETTQAMDQLADALRGMEAEGLRRFNLSVSQSGSRTRDFTSAIDQLAQRQANSTTQSRTMAEEVSATTRALERMVGAIAGAIAKASELSEIFRFVADTFDTQGRDREIQGRNFLIQAAERARERGLAREAVDNLARSGRVGEDQIEGLRRAMSVRGIDLQRLTNIREYSRSAYNANDGVARTMIGNLLRTELQPLIDRQAQAEHTANVRSQMDADAQRKVRKLGDAAEGAAHQLTNVQRAAARGLRARGGVNPLSNEEFSDLLGQLAAPTEGELGEESARRTKAEAAFAEERAGVERDRARQQRRFARDRQTRIQSVSQGRSVGAGIQRGLGVSADALETEAKLTQGYADTIVGAFDKIGSAITRHVELVASGQETIGQAVLAGTHEVTKAIAMEALPRSLMELAAGFAALANPVTAATAPLHFTAAAVYGGVAAGAGLVAGVTGALGGAGAPAAAAGATGAARAASGATPPPREEAAAPVSIYLNSTVPPGPRELQTLVAATRQSNRYQLDSRAQMVPRSVRA